MFNANVPDRTARSDYAVNAGTVYVESNAFPQNYGAAVPNFAWFEKSLGATGSTLVLNGISFQRSEVTLQQVTDGSSNTYMVGEKALTSTNYETGADAGDNETWCTGYNNDNFRKTASGAFGSLTA